MKKLRTIFFLLIASFAFSSKVFANTYLTADKTDVKVGDNFEIIANFAEISSWNINISSTDNASNCTITENGTTSNGQNENKTFNTTCTALAEGTITITLSGSVIVTNDSENGEKNEINESVEITVTANEEPKGLSTLQVTGGSLSPLFDSNNIENTGYTITLNSSETTTFSITALAKTTTDTIKPTRENNSNYESIDLNNITFITSGNNNTMLIEINVGEGDRLVKYTLTVIKPTKIDSPELLNLTVGKQNVPLVSDIYRYNLTLDEEDYEDDGSYQVKATLKDSVNYMFDEFLVPPIYINVKEFTITIIPKDPTAGLSSREYTIKVSNSVIEPVTTTKDNTTAKSNKNYQDNPQTGSTPAYVVGIMLFTSLITSMYLYKKNINGYN